MTRQADAGEGKRSWRWACEGTYSQVFTSIRRRPWCDVDRDGRAKELMIRVDEVAYPRQAVVRRPLGCIGLRADLPLRVVVCDVPRRRASDLEPWTCASDRHGSRLCPALPLRHKAARLAFLGAVDSCRLHAMWLPRAVARRREV